MYFLKLCLYCVYGQMSEMKNYYYIIFKTKIRWKGIFLKVCVVFNLSQIVLL